MGTIVTKHQKLAEKCDFDIKYPINHESIEVEVHNNVEVNNNGNVHNDEKAADNNSKKVHNNDKEKIKELTQCIGLYGYDPKICNNTWFNTIMAEIVDINARNSEVYLIYKLTSTIIYRGNNIFNELKYLLGELVKKNYNFANLVSSKDYWLNLLGRRYHDYEILKELSVYFINSVNPIDQAIYRILNGNTLHIDLIPYNILDEILKKLPISIGQYCQLENIRPELPITIVARLWDRYDEPLLSQWKYSAEDLLITCAENNYINATIALCKKGVNIYHKTQNGKTASMIAYEKGHIDIALIMGALRAPITPQRGSG